MRVTSWIRPLVPPKPSPTYLQTTPSGPSTQRIAAVQASGSRLFHLKRSERPLWPAQLPSEMQTIFRPLNW